MPSTACTMPSSVENSTTRSRIERIRSGTDPPLRRIERVAQAVAHEVHAEHDCDDRQPRKYRQPPLLRVRLPLLHEHTERRGRRLDTEAEERKGGLRDDRYPHRERPVDDDRPERVREDVPEHDSPVARTGRL